MSEALASKTCTPCRGGIPHSRASKLSSFTHPIIETAANIRSPIALAASRCQTSRDFVPWRFLDAGFYEPDVRRYRIRLSDWLHREAHDGAVNGRRSRRRSPRSGRVECLVIAGPSR
jgi:hypothetical protein